MKPFNEHNPIIGKKMNVGDEGLHGDVILRCEDSLPSNFDNMVIVKDDCLAYGELTGHAHKLFGGEFELRECPKTKVRHLKVVTPTMLKHQEHCPVEINPGIYRIGIQEEYDPFEKHLRKVQD